MLPPKKQSFRVKNLTFIHLSLNRIGESMNSDLFKGLPLEIGLKRLSINLEGTGGFTLHPYRTMRKNLSDFEWS